MKIEPGVAVGATSRVPGDKSISHRARAARRGRRRRERDPRLRPRRRTPSRRSPPCARSASRSTRTTATTLRVHGRGLRGLRAPERADRLRQRGHADAPARRAARRPGGHASSSIGDESLSLAADGADRRAAAPDGRRGRDDRRHAAVDDRRAAPLHADPLRAAGGERAGEVGVLLAGLYADEGRRRSSSRCRRATTPSACSPALGVARPSASARARSRSGPSSGSRRSTSRSRATSPPRRRSSSRRRSSRARELTHPRRRTSTRRAPASSTCSSGWARGSRVFNRRTRRRRARRRPRGRARRARRDRAIGAERGAAAWSTSCRCSRSPPRWRAARASSAAPRSCASRRPTGSTTVADALRALGVRIRRRRRTASGSAASRRGLRGGAIDARGDHRIAMLGRRGGPRLPRGRRDRGRGGGRCKLPRVLRPPPSST